MKLNLQFCSLFIAK